MVSAINGWKPANLDKIQQLASAAGYSYGAGFGDIGYSQADLVERANREARERERAVKEALEAERREAQRRAEAERQRQEAARQEELERERIRKEQEEEERLRQATRETRETREAREDERSVEPAIASYSDDDIDDDFEVIDLDTLEVDDLVIVREDFISDSDDGEELLRGQRGQIVEIDVDGDAYIRFREHRKKQWVYSQNFMYLAKVLFDKGDAVVARRSFECGSMHVRRGQTGGVCRVDAGGDVLISFSGDLGEQWVQYYSLVFLEKEKPKAASGAKEAKLWLYNPPHFRDVAIRTTPSIEGPRSNLTLRPGQRFMVSEEIIGSDGILYLRLADGTGWMFESKPGSGTLCVPQAGGMPKDLLARLGGPAGRQEDDDKIMHVEDAKAFLISMDKVLASKPVQSLVEGLREVPGNKQHLTEVQKGLEMELVREKAKRLLVDACKGVFKRFGFEVSQEGQEELIEALREHEHDDTVYIVATNIEMALQIPAGGWFGLTQLRKGMEVAVNELGPGELLGKTSALERFHNGKWQLRFGDEVTFLAPEQLDLRPDPQAHKELAKQRNRKVSMKEEDLAHQAQLMSSTAAARKHLPSGGKVPEKAPWWQTCFDRASSRADSRRLEREYLALASGSEEAFCESLKQGRKVAKSPWPPLAIQDEPLRPVHQMIEEIEAADHRDQVQQSFRALARRPRAAASASSNLSTVSGTSSSSQPGRRRGAFSSRAGALREEEEERQAIPEAEEEEDSDELRSAEAHAQRGDLRPLLRQQKFACARKDAALRLMTGNIEGDAGTLAVEGRNQELPPRLTRAQCAQEEFERQRARWHLPPRGKHVGHMPQAHALGAGQGNLGALEEGLARGSNPRERSWQERPAPASWTGDFGGLPSFSDGPGFFKGGFP